MCVYIYFLKVPRKLWGLRAGVPSLSDQRAIRHHNNAQAALASTGQGAGGPSLSQDSSKFWTLNFRKGE